MRFLSFHFYNKFIFIQYIYLSLKDLMLGLSLGISSLQFSSYVAMSQPSNNATQVNAFYQSPEVPVNKLMKSESFELSDNEGDVS